MRHRSAGRKLGRTTAHRIALLRNLATALLREERIETTLPKAKELRPFAEKIITLAKKDSLHARRLVYARLGDHQLVQKLFDEIAPVYAQRPGGYTRIYRLGERRGDGGQLALIELVDRAPAPTAAKGKTEAAEKPAKVKKAAAPKAEKKAKVAKSEAKSGRAKKQGAK